MKGARTIAFSLFLIGCDRAAPHAEQPGGGGGAALERAAVSVGIVADPAKLDPIGAYSSETDRVCIVRKASGYRIGASVDYGEQQGCVARGTATGRGTLHVDFGDKCQFDARFDGERIVFPATLPPRCDRRCTGRATLAAVNVNRLSVSDTEARGVQAIDGGPLCG